MAATGNSNSAAFYIHNAGALGKVFLRHFGVEVRSHVRSIGPERAATPAELELARDGAAHAWWQQVEESPIRTGDAAFEGAATELIKTARTAGHWMRPPAFPEEALWAST